MLIRRFLVLLVSNNINTFRETWFLKIEQTVKTTRIFQDLRSKHSASSFLHRKEVIQPQVLLRLPCYDFTPIADPTLGRFLLLRG